MHWENFTSSVIYGAVVYAQVILQQQGFLLCLLLLKYSSKTFILQIAGVPLKDNTFSFEFETFPIYHSAQMDYHDWTERVYRLAYI